MSNSQRIDRSLRPKENKEQQSLPKGKSIVVSIGINEYQNWQQLQNGVNDAIGFQKIMIDKLGFTAPIEPLINGKATQNAIERLVKETLWDIVEKDDNLIIFFAGHGHTRVETETGYIIPVEARSPNPKEYWGDYIRLNQWLENIADLPARHILVILDACHSGFALGEAMKRFRDPVTYTKDLNKKKSRKVITSARRDQPALDGGSIPGHSLFTGTLIDGFNWGKADLDGNGLITSLELGLYIQQKVGQASESKQTPDFGSFYLDDRGEMVIALKDQSFDALKARAFSALQRCEFTTFKDLVEQLNILNENNTVAIYLKYRLELFQANLKEACDSLKHIYEIGSDQNIPISMNDILKIISYLNIPSWAYGFEIEESDFPLSIDFCKVVDDNLITMNEQQFGEADIYSCECNSIVQFRIKNLSEIPIYLYLVEIDSLGRIEMINLWSNTNLNWEGIQPSITEYSYTLKIVKAGNFNLSCQLLDGINEMTFLSSTQRIEQLLFPPNPNSRYGLQGLKNLQNIEIKELKNIRRKTIRYRIV